MIVLRQRKAKNIQAFMDAYHADTYSNPFNPHERVWRMKVRLTLSAFQDYIWISAVESIEPRKGHGSQCMDWLLDLVIEHGVMIKGNIQPFGPKGFDKDLLREWYAQCGFDVNSHNEVSFNGEDK